MDNVLKNKLMKIGEINLRVMEINDILSNLYEERRGLENEMKKIRSDMCEYAGKTGQTIGEVSE